MLFPTYYLLPTCTAWRGRDVDESDDLGRDLVAEARAVEDAIMADPRLQMVEPHGRRQGAAESWAASVWPTPDMSSRSPSTVISTVR